MNNSSSGPNDDIENLIGKYSDLLFRISLIKLGNASDAEDTVQDTFIKYYSKALDFNDEEHRKAWLIRVCVNRCMDLIRYRKNHLTINIDEINELSANEELADSGIIEALMQLPDKYRTVLLLYYTEDLSTEQISKIIGKTASAVKMRLKKGRKLLADKYKEGVNADEN